MRRFSHLHAIVLMLKMAWDTPCREGFKTIDGDLLSRIVLSGMGVDTAFAALRNED